MPTTARLGLCQLNPSAESQLNYNAVASFDVYLVRFATSVGNSLKELKTYFSADTLRPQLSYYFLRAVSAMSF